MNFTELDLNEEIQKGIENAGYVTCTPVQEQVLLRAKDGADLYVQSQTGTGKTAAYLIAVIRQMLANPEAAGKKALIMAPTRELAVQIEEEAKTLLKFSSLRTASFYGGVGYTGQHSQLKQGVDILIGTPGRVIDLQESGTMDLSNVGFLVIDEADRMFDMGFYPDLRTLIKMLPDAKHRQTMLFSATLNTYVKNLAWEYTEDAEEITIEADQITVTEIDQQLLHVSSDDKMKLLIGILQREKPESAIIFCNTKKMTEIVAKRLQMNGFKTEFIIGDLPQAKRLQVMDSFKNGKLACLTATDVAARGIDVNDLALVVNFDLPNEAENYVHRIGRTARAGKTGKAYTFCSEQDVYNLPAIEKYVEVTIPSIVVSDDMFGEDKSTGTYIRTGRYGDEEDDRYDRRGPRSDRGRRGERMPPRRDAAPRGAKAPLRGEKPRRGAAYTKAPQENRNRGGQDLSGLSFEERMKVYRQKYAGRAPAEGEARPGANAERRRGPKQTGGEGRGGQNRQKGRETQRRDGQNPRQMQGARPPAKPQTKPQNTGSGQKQAPAPKGGLLSRLKALFTGKKN